MKNLLLILFLCLSTHQLQAGETVTAQGMSFFEPGREAIALDKGGAKCVDAIWTDLRSQLTRIWEEEFYSQRKIDLIVKNVPSHARALEIANTFKSDVSNVVSAELIQFSKKGAEYGLSYEGWPEHMVNELQMSYFKNHYFETVLEEISGNRITIRIKNR